MNKYIIILISVFTVSSCKVDAPKDYILFSGKISNPTGEKFQLSHRDGRGRLSAEISEDGSFTLDTIKSGTGTYRFEGRGVNRVTIYLENGGDYTFNFNEKEMVDTAILTGPRPNPSKYLMTKGKRIDSLRGNFTAYKTLEPEAFKAKSALVRDNLLTYLDSFEDMPENFKAFERSELINYYLLYLIRYEYIHGQETGTLDTFRVSDSFLSELEGVDYNDEAAYKHRGYYSSLVKEYYEHQAFRIAEEEERNYDIVELEVFGAVTNDYIKNDLLAKSASSSLSEIHNLDEYYNTFLKVSTSKKNNETVTKRYIELKKLSKGAPSPEFTDYINHAGGTSSLSDFRGKYVYIDMWATWCGPCLKEVPSLKKVEEQYHDKNIEFISISIDTKEKEDAWRKMVTEKELGGTQLLAQGDWGSTMIKEYQIKGIPRFILIDPQGNIIEAKAPRPSDSKLIELFKELGI